MLTRLGYWSRELVSSNFVETTVSGLRMGEPNYGFGTLGSRVMPVCFLEGFLVGLYCAYEVWAHVVYCLRH